MLQEPSYGASTGIGTMEATRRVLGLASVQALPDVVKAGLRGAGLLDARMLATLEDESSMELLYEQAAGTTLVYDDRLRGGLLLRAVVVESQQAAILSHSSSWTSPSYDCCVEALVQQRALLVASGTVDMKYIVQAKTLPGPRPPVRWATKKA